MSDDDARERAEAPEAVPEVPLQPLRPGGGIPKPLWIAGALMVAGAVGFVGGVQVGSQPARTGLAPSPSPTSGTGASPSPTTAAEAWSRGFLAFTPADVLPAGADCVIARNGQTAGRIAGSGSGAVEIVASWMLSCRISANEREHLVDEILGNLERRIGGGAEQGQGNQEGTGLHVISYAAAPNTGTATLATRATDTGVEIALTVAERTGPATSAAAWGPSYHAELLDPAAAVPRGTACTKTSLGSLSTQRDGASEAWARSWILDCPVAAADQQTFLDGFDNALQSLIQLDSGAGQMAPEHFGLYTYSGPGYVGALIESVKAGPASLQITISVEERSAG